MTPIVAWFILGTSLLIVELVSRKGYIFWYSMASFLVSLVAYIYPSVEIRWQVAGWLLAVILLSFFWYFYRNYFFQKKPLFYASEEMIGRKFTLTKPIKKNYSKIELDGIVWYLRCHQNHPVGTEVVVYEVDGVILKVRENIN